LIKLPPWCQHIVPLLLPVSDGWLNFLLYYYYLLFRQKFKVISFPSKLLFLEGISLPRVISNGLNLFGGHAPVITHYILCFISEIDLPFVSGCTGM